MSDTALLMSIRPEHADNILRGEKTVELRRLRPRLSPGDSVVVYVSSPVQAIMGSFTVDRVIEASPRQLWEHVGDACGLSRQRYDAYFAGAAVGYGIVIRRASRRSSPVSLDALRKAYPGFCPPQGYYYLRLDRHADAAICACLNAA